MVGATIFYEVPETVPIRQGDIVRSDDIDEQGSAGWCVVITADCDIAQGKMGASYTCLEIVSAAEYLASHWAADELQKLRRKYEDQAIDLILTADRGRDAEVEAISPADLADWLLADGPTAIVAMLNMTGKAAQECTKALGIVHLTLQNNGTALERLKGAWGILNRSQKEQDGALRTALKAGQMRSDYILLPTLPGERDVGFIVLLRAIRAIPPNIIYPSRLRYRISGATSGFFRLGRLEDFLRYSIAQRWASLFSRIGMTDHFEVECDSAADLILSQF